nr:EOG090X0ADH [Triops cancriformis]
MRLTAFLRNGFESVGEITKKVSNFPDFYIKKTMEQVYYRSPRGLPQYLPKDIKRRKYRFTMNRPWTEEFKRQNAAGQQRKKVFIEPIKEWTIFKGDRVEVMVGKDKGKLGLVNYVVQERNWVTVEGLNTHLRRVAGSAEYSGIFVRSEAPLLVTNQVALVDPSDNKPTSVEWRYTEQGDRVRVSVRTGRILPVPQAAEETIDFKSRANYTEQPKDTVAADASEVSFKPSLNTFELDLAQKYGLLSLEAEDAYQ